MIEDCRLQIKAFSWLSFKCLSQNMCLIMVFSVSYILEQWFAHVHSSNITEIQSKNECWRKWTVVWFPGYCIKKAVEISQQGLSSFFTLSHCNKVLCNLCKVETFVYDIFLQSRWMSERGFSKIQSGIYDCSICFVIKKKQEAHRFAVVRFK